MKSLKAGNTVMNLMVVVLGILAGAGIFAVIQRVNNSKEVNELIPNANSARQNGEYSSAINLFQKAEKEYPNDVEVQKSLAELFYLKGKYDEAISYYSKIPSQQLNDSDYEKFGDAYLQKNNIEKTIQTWQGKKLSKQSTYKLAKIFYNKNDLESYTRELQKITDTQEGLILTQINQENLNLIIENSNTALALQRISNDKLQVSSFKSQIENALNQKNAAKDDFSELIQIAAFAELDQCRFLFDRISSLRQTLQSKKIPTAQLDYYEGVCFNQISEPDKAIPLLQNAVASDTTVIEYREALGRSYFLKSDVENMRKTYDEIFILDENSRYYMNLGYFYYKLGNFDEAITLYNKAFEISSSEEEKKELALSITQISLLDKQDLEICKREDLLAILSGNSSDEEKIILGHCNIHLKRFTSENSNALIPQYFAALEKKDSEKIVTVLDKDLDGLVTSYYKAVGVKILEEGVN